jgi:hypothetical protein
MFGPLVTRVVIVKTVGESEWQGKCYLADGSRYTPADCFESTRRDCEQTANAILAQSRELFAAIVASNPPVVFPLVITY